MQRFTALLPPRGRQPRAWLQALALLPVVATAIGVALHGLVDRHTVSLVLVYVVLAGAVLVGSVALRRLAGGSLVSWIAIGWCACLAWFCGVGPVVGAAALSLAALASGQWTAGVRNVAGATIVGLVVLGGLTGWLLQAPIHTQWAGWLLVVGVIAWRRGALSRTLSVARVRWHVCTARSPAVAAVGASIVGIATTAAWLPNLQSDDLSYHLALPTQLLQDAAYRPDVALQLWAYAPWVGDTLHGIVAVLAGRVAHGALNAAWLVLLAASAWRLAAVLGASHAMRWVGLAIVVSIPMVGGLATGMHTELPAAALSLALFAVAFERPHARLLRQVALLAAGLLALKTMHIAAVAPVLVFAAIRHGRFASGHARALAVGIVLVFGGASYVHAYLATGNPVFPLANGFFRSPAWVAENFADGRWREPLSWRTPYDLVFHTDRFLEIGRASIGVTLLAFAGVVAWATTQRRWWFALTLGAATWLIPLAVVPYARYLLPGLVCFTVIACVAASRLFDRTRTLAMAACIVALHLLVLPSGNYLLSTKALRMLVETGGDAHKVMRKFLPERSVLAAIPVGGGIVLSTAASSPYTALFGRDGRTVSWYAPTLSDKARAADADATGAAWHALIEEVGPNWLLIDRRSASDGLKRALSDRGAERHASESHAEVWRLRAADATTDQKP